MQNNEVQQLTEAGVPDSELENVRAALAVGVSFQTLLSLWIKYKDQIPLFWQLLKDIIAAVKGDETTPTVDPFAK